MTVDGIIITCMRRDPDGGYWTAHVTPAGGRPVRVDRRYGSWQTAPTRGHRRFVLPAIAAELQARARRLERHETPEAVTA